jgi:uncharacterized peroxidase-related enzyme
MLSPADFAMLEFGEKLTVIPSAMSVGDVIALRAAGFADREIVAITAAAAYRNFITRVADGLGVELGQHGDGYYDPAVLGAFGVTEAAVGGTFYSDRQVAPGLLPEKSAKEEKAQARGQLGSAPRVQLRRNARTRAVSAREGIDRASAIRAQSRSDDRRRCWIDHADVAKVGNAERLPNLAAALSLKPDTLAATVEFASLINRSGSELDARVEAIIGLTVAATAGLSYLGAHHAQHLLDSGATPPELRIMIDNPADAALDPREREVAGFCEKLTRAPGTMARADVEILRGVGFDDPAIVTIVVAAAFANYLGRIGASLGAIPEESLSEPARTAI